MEKTRQNLRERIGSASSSSLVASEYQRCIREIGVVLEKLHQLVMTRVCSENDLELAETLNDEVKPVIDWLIHFEVPRAPAK